MRGPFDMNIFGPFSGWFAVVTSLVVNGQGIMFAADFYNDRIQKFDAEGDYLTAFAPDNVGGPGHTETTVAVAADGTVFSANFKGNRVERWQRP